MGAIQSATGIQTISTEYPQVSSGGNQSLLATAQLQLVHSEAMESVVEAYSAPEAASVKGLPGDIALENALSIDKVDADNKLGSDPAGKVPNASKPADFFAYLDELLKSVQEDLDGNLKDEMAEHLGSKPDPDDFTSNEVYQQALQSWMEGSNDIAKKVAMAQNLIKTIKGHQSDALAANMSMLRADAENVRSLFKMV